VTKVSIDLLSISNLHKTLLQKGQPPLQQNEFNA
jgi:hypothetical protein